MTIAYVPQTLLECKERLQQVSTELTAIADGLQLAYERQKVGNTTKRWHLEDMANDTAQIAATLNLGP